MTSRVALNEVDGVEIISLADNTVDFSSTIKKEEAKRVREWVKERMGEERVKNVFGFRSLNTVFRC